MTFKPATRRPRTDLDRVFNTFFNTSIPATTRKPVATKTAVNIVETDEDFRLELAAPGWQKTDFQMEVKEDALTVTASRENTPKEDEKVLRREFRYANIKRTFHLPDAIDTTQINAQYENGVLTVQLPKKPEAKPQAPRQIEVA